MYIFVINVYIYCLVMWVKNKSDGNWIVDLLLVKGLICYYYVIRC